MWKKLLGIMAVLGLLASQVATAAYDAGTTPVPSVTSPLKALTVTPSTFNPGKGEKVTVLVEVNEPSIVTLKVLDPATSMPVDTLYSSEVVQTSKSVTYGGVLDDGSTLKDGKYSVNASVVAVSRKSATDGYADLTVTSTPSNGSVTIDKFTTSSTTYNPEVSGSTLTFTYELSKAADVEVSIVNSAGNSVYKFTAKNTQKGTFTWDGKDTAGVVVPVGSYKAVITVTLNGTTVTAETPFTVSTTTVTECKTVSSTIVKNVTVDPCTWDPSDEELDINWELYKDVKDFSLVAKKVDGGKEVELTEDEDLDSDDYEYEWNGLDGDDEYISEGTWELKFEADNDKVSAFVTVKYLNPAVVDDMFVSKTSFDNSIGETTYVVFRLDNDSIVTVDAMKGTKKLDTLMDEEELDKNVWYAVKWDGTDDDGDEVDEGTYSFRVTAANVANDHAKSTRSVDVEVAEDEVSSGKSNVTNDFIVPVIVEKTTTTGATITYQIDEDAEVTVAIYKGSKSSNPEVILEKNVSKTAGTYTISWDGHDEDGKKLDKNTKYSYLVTAKVSGSSNKTDKERGYFVVGATGKKGDEPTPTPAHTPDYDCSNVGFWDVYENSPYCEAIAWAEENGVFEGYPDGSFGQYDFINRVETLKVVLNAFGVPVLHDDYSTLGFKDVTPGAWYMKYLRTGKFYGMINGYQGSMLVAPESEINRVELLKYVIEAAETVNNYKVPVCNSAYYSDVDKGAWYSDYICLAHDYDLFNTYSGYFFPGNQVTRGEVALVLYRLSEAGLL